jgi:hypothetical protein
MSFKTQKLNLYGNRCGSSRSGRCSQLTTAQTPKEAERLELSDLDLDPDFNSNKIFGQIEPKLLTEKYQKRRLNAQSEFNKSCDFTKTFN